MRLDEFIELLRKDIDGFQAHYQTGHAEAPSDWPLSMFVGEWYEQWLAYMETQSAE